MEVNQSFWLGLGLVLAGELIYALVMALLVRLFRRYSVPGQTYWMVVVGVAGVVLIASPLIGCTSFAILAACFAVAGLVMGVEYFMRLLDEHAQAEQERKDALQ
jgi:drug/metabolite transporter (DMT)-like permease